MKAVVAAFNQEKALVGAFSVITNLRMELFQALAEEEQARLRLEEEENEEVRRINKRIREIEESIAELDWQLEREKIEHMKKKTRKVINRISQVVSEEDTEESDTVKKETIRLFLLNKSMWKKYVNLETEE